MEREREVERGRLERKTERKGWCEIKVVREREREREREKDESQHNLAEKQNGGFSTHQRLQSLLCPEHILSDCIGVSSMQTDYVCMYVCVCVIE